MKPNLLLIMADQFRADSMTQMGGGIKTPHIDRIIRKGVFFDKASCTSPLCTPSRASLATGKYPHNCGVMVHDASLPLDQITYYQLLRKNGYRTAVIGKTDLHKDYHYYGKNAPLPVMYHYGFTDPDEVEGKMNLAFYPVKEDGTKELVGPYQRYLETKGVLDSITKDYHKRLEKLPVWYAEKSVLRDEDFQDTYIGRKACEFLEQVDEEYPWHLMVSFAGPHDPWDPPEYALSKVGDTIYPPSIEDDMQGKPDWIKKKAQNQSYGLTQEKVQNLKKHYAAYVVAIDDCIGRILDVLERREMCQNTVVVFCADHGEMLGDHNLFQKSVMYEGALRIPLVINIPGYTNESRNHALVELMDLAPTFLELAGVDYNIKEMDGVSILPLIREEKKEIKKFQKSELHNTMMLFDGRYKWIRNYNDEDELYDLTKDSQERHNCIKEKQDILAYMRQYTFRS